MPTKKGRSEERKNIFGDRYIQHFDENGLRAGRSEERTGFIGDKHTQHYDKSGTSTGRSEERKHILGDKYDQHYDRAGAKAGWSEKRTSILGGRYTNHYERMPPWTSGLPAYPPVNSGSSQPEKTSGGVLALLAIGGLILVSTLNNNLAPSRPMPAASSIARGGATFGAEAVPQISHTSITGPASTVVAWGDNTYRQCDVPSDLRRVVAIAAGARHSFALRQDGTVIAWGSNGSGQCNVPANLSRVVAIAAGANHSLALRKDGNIVAWGYFVAVSVPASLSDVTAISAGFNFSLALRRDGTVVAWGGVDTWGERDVPQGLSSVVAIAAGETYSLARRQDGTVVAWGWNNKMPKKLLRECSGVFLQGGIEVQATQVEKDVIFEPFFAPITKGLFDQP
ncbi:MAG: RCC1 domain-containing protein, partial [Limisphaerales bacterium]